MADTKECALLTKAIIQEGCPEQRKGLPEDIQDIQHTATDLFQLQGHTFLVYADRYTGWVEVYKPVNTNFKTLKHVFTHWFMSFGSPVELSSDGGPPFNSAEYAEFLRKWNVSMRKSSVSYPQSNGRAEAAVKSAKRILEGNINPVTGQLDTDLATKAMLNHRNTPNQETGISPAVALYGYPLKDHLPRHGPFRQEWQEILDARDTAHARRHLRPVKDPRALQSLTVGDAVQIQNQSGNKPNKWHNTGVITESLQHR